MEPETSGSGDGGASEVDRLTPAYLKGFGSGSTGRRARNAENRTAKALGGRRYPASGSKSWDTDDQTTARGDIRTPEFHIEHKHTVRESLTVTREWLRTVSAGAKRQLRDPMLVIRFMDETACPDEWAVIPMEVLQRLLALSKS